MKHIYVSIDIEADGPIPGENSMLSLGAAAFYIDSTEPIATFEVNINALADARQDDSTMQFWAKNQEAWEYIHQNPRTPESAIRKFLAWTKELDGKPTMVCYPTWDWMWIHWYILKFGHVEHSPYGLGCLDIKTLASIAMKKPHRLSTKRRMPKSWFKDTPTHNHTALQDAIGQGVLFVNIMNQLNN